VVGDRDFFLNTWMQQKARRLRSVGRVGVSAARAPDPELGHPCPHRPTARERGGGRAWRSQTAVAEGFGADPGPSVAAGTGLARGRDG